MDLGRARREGVEPAGDAIVETGADGDHQIAIVHRIIGLERPVHAEHAEPVAAGGRIGAEPHQGRGDRKAGEFDEFAQQRRGLRPGIDDAAAGIEDRPLRLGHHRDRLLDLGGIALELRAIGLVLDIRRPDIGAGRELHVLGNIDHDRAGPPGLGDQKSLMQDARQILDRAHQIIVLGAMPGDADRVGFLERVRADEMGRHLAGDADDRDRIHQRVGEAGDGIGGAGPRRHQQHADLAGGTRIALRRMGRALLVAHEHMLDEVLVEQRVIDRQHRAARIAENRIDALILQGLHNHFRAAHLVRHVIRPSVGPRARGGIPGNKKGPRGASACASCRSGPIPVPFPAHKLR